MQVVPLPAVVTPFAASNCAGQPPAQAQGSSKLQQVARSQHLAKLQVRESVLCKACTPRKRGLKECCSNYACDVFAGHSPFGSVEISGRTALYWALFVWGSCALMWRPEGPRLLYGPPASNTQLTLHHQENA